MNWNSFHVLDLFIRMTLNSKSVVFDQQQNQGKEFHSTEAFRIQTDGASDILKMWLPRSITQVFTSRRPTKIKDSGEMPAGRKSHWPEYISLARTWSCGFYLTAGEAGIYSLAVGRERRGNGFVYYVVIPAIPSKYICGIQPLLTIINYNYVHSIVVCCTEVSMTYAKQKLCVATFLFKRCNSHSQNPESSSGQQEPT